MSQVVLRKVSTKLNKTALRYAVVDFPSVFSAVAIDIFFDLLNFQFSLVLIMLMLDLS
jgi:hypothetical protein